MPAGHQPKLRCGDRRVPVWHEPMPVAIVLDHLRSAFNVGNIFRLADAVRVAKIITCGYTPTPPHPKLTKTARGCDALLPTRHMADAAAAVRELRADGYRVYGVDTVRDAPSVWDMDLTFPAAFVFGNEALGVGREALNACDGFVALPCFGTKNSINVGNCAAVVLYEVLRRWLQCSTTTQVAIKPR